MRVYIEYGMVRFFLGLARLLPSFWLYALCKALGKLIYALEPRRRNVTLKNLALAFPSMHESDRRILAQKSYENVAITLAEILLIFHKKVDIDSLIENKEEVLPSLKLLFKDKERGKLLITAHFGNWELLAQFLAKQGYPMVGVGRKGNNRLIEEQITKPFRSLYGNTMVEKNKAMNAIVRTFSQKKIAGMLIDQKVGAPSGLRATFFAQPADTVSSTALLIQRYDPIVLPLFLARQENGRYKLLLEPSHPKTLSSTEALTQYYNDVIEKVVREYPEQWFWMHNRWRLS